MSRALLLVLAVGVPNAAVGLRSGVEHTHTKPSEAKAALTARMYQRQTESSVAAEAASGSLADTSLAMKKGKKDTTTKTATEGPQKKGKMYTTTKTTTEGPHRGAGVPAVRQQCNAPDSVLASGNATSRSELKTLEFYMYRANDGGRSSAQNINTASAAGVMRYIHVEVIGQDVCGSCNPPLCKRKYDIDRVVRYKVKMQNTPEVYQVQKGQFGPFRQFDHAQCTWGGVDKCQETWQKYGYVVGCQEQNVEHFHYPDAVWYSLPGTCPSRNWREKDAKCKQEEPGGWCWDEDGWSGCCTYHMEEAGHVYLDEVVGLQPNYTSFCEAGGVEYKVHDEGASTIDFWKGYTDPSANAARTKALLEAFEKNFPEHPRLDMPRCDGF